MANFLSLLSIAFATLCLTSHFLVEAQNGGFSVELVHRDSPKSPFYNPSESSYNRVAKALQRSFNRANRFSNPSSVSTKAINAEIIADAGEFLMNVSIGTPPFPIVGIADTGSDLIWTQCQPCTQCFQQDAPLFDPSESSTYKVLSCSTSQCESFEGTSCSSDNSCHYSTSYGDRSFSNGDLAADTITLPSTTGRPVAIPTTVIGCGHNNGGTFNDNTTGIIGLGGGDVSLITQLGNSIAGKFSYCLLPISDAGNSSTMNFGSDAVVSGPDVVSTPLTKKSPATFYFLTLEAISVGSNRIEFSGSSFGSDGNIIIDSGTTLTLLPEDFYSELESAVASEINATRVDGPAGLNLCYDVTTDFAVPNITIHFTDADVSLAPLNTFVLVSETVACFTFNANQDIAIYGNLAQMNFLVGYDTQEQTVSFKPTDCSNN
ncbi:Peptidase A1 [Corchorus olitorius]|uniref:Peptidase A1 n=1 Tax=Corchorus olitorius TaxID=93759 RepID=A0A1R3HKX3_9ROSI|nr:Peptidase A1 [Corchorus olitorius]